MSANKDSSLPLSSATCAGLQRLACDPEAAAGSAALFASMPALEELYLFALTPLITMASRPPPSMEQQAALLAGLARAPRLQQVGLHCELVRELDEQLGLPPGGVLEEWGRQLPGVRVYDSGDCEGWPRPLVLPAWEAAE